MPLSPGLEHKLERWTAARVIDPPTAMRIRAFEEQNEKRGALRWPTLLALAFGGLLLAAGVLLFVAAHWDSMSPASRFATVLALTAVFHVGGAIAAARWRALSMVLHGVGTVAVGAGIFLTAQIFNLQEHWPSGVMLWALGAWIGWWLLRDWVQALFAAALTPAWLASEWFERTQWYTRADVIGCAFLLALAVVYFTAGTSGGRSALMRGLMWVGGLTILVDAFIFAEQCFEEPYSWRSDPEHLSVLLWAISIVLAVAAPVLMSFLLERRFRFQVGMASVWILLLAVIGETMARQTQYYSDLIAYPWAAAASIGMIFWGLSEHRKERINMGVAGFALAVFTFYFSNVMDKLGRSLSLIGLGLLFLLGGWILERTRRKLVWMAQGAA